MTDKIKITCPVCKKEKRAKRIPDSDPPSAVEMELTCPDCACGDFSDPRYWNEFGEEVFQE